MKPSLKKYVIGTQGRVRLRARWAIAQGPQLSKRENSHIHGKLSV